MKELKNIAINVLDDMQSAISENWFNQFLDIQIEQIEKASTKEEINIRMNFLCTLADQLLIINK